MLQNHSLLFQFACRFVRYFILFLLGLGTACLISALLGFPFLTMPLLKFIAFWWWRLSLCSIVMLGTAIIFESLK